MKKIFNLLLLLVAFNVSAQFEHATKVELKDVEELPVALIDTRVLITDPVTGEIKYIPLSTIKALGMEVDLSNYVTKDTDEEITSRKTLNKTSTRDAGFTFSNTGTSSSDNSIELRNDGHTSLYINNYGDFGQRIHNRGNGYGFRLNGYSTGASLDLFNLYESTGNSLIVSKQAQDLSINNVFKIDNVGNTTTQKLTAQVIDEDLTADKVIVTDASGELKSVPKASLEQDLSDVSYKSVNETIVGKKTFDVTGNPLDGINGGIQIENNAQAFGVFAKNYLNGTGIQVNNYSTGIGSSIFNYANGIGSRISNDADGRALMINNTLDSTGDTFIVFKGTEQNPPVFKVDNVGNLTAQEITAEVINENNTATKVLVADDNGKVGYVDKTSINEGYLPLTGGQLTGVLTYKGNSINGQNIFNVRYDGVGTINNVFTERGSSDYSIGYGVKTVDNGAGLVSSTAINIPRSVVKITNNGIEFSVAPQQATEIGQPITGLVKYDVYHTGNAHRTTNITNPSASDLNSAFPIAENPIGCNVVNIGSTNAVYYRITATTWRKSVTVPLN